MMEISSNNLDHLTRALFAHLRGAGEMGLDILRCPVCPETLEALLLDFIRENDDDRIYQRVWWTCRGLRTRTCLFPLHIPPDVFWTQRTTEQINKDIIPLPNLDILPPKYYHYYPQYFENGTINPLLRDLLKAQREGNFSQMEKIESEMTLRTRSLVSRKQKIKRSSSTQDSASDSGRSEMSSQNANQPSEANSCENLLDLDDAENFNECLYDDRLRRTSTPTSELVLRCQTPERQQFFGPLTRRNQFRHSKNSAFKPVLRTTKTTTKADGGYASPSHVSEQPLIGTPFTINTFASSPSERSTSEFSSNDSTTSTTTRRKREKVKIDETTNLMEISIGDFISNHKKELCRGEEMEVLITQQIQKNSTFMAMNKQAQAQAAQARISEITDELSRPTARYACTPKLPKPVKKKEKKGGLHELNEIIDIDQILNEVAHSKNVKSDVQMLREQFSPSKRFYQHVNQRCGNMRTHVPSERSLSEASAKSTPSLHTEINTPRTETEVQNRPVKKRKAPFGEFTELNQLFSNNLKKIRTELLSSTKSKKRAENDKLRAKEELLMEVATVSTPVSEHTSFSHVATVDTETTNDLGSSYHWAKPTVKEDANTLQRDESYDIPQALSPVGTPSEQQPDPSTPQTLAQLVTYSLPALDNAQQNNDEAFPLENPIGNEGISMDPSDYWNSYPSFDFTSDFTSDGYLLL